ncbi:MULTISPECIES: acetyl-CoA carboxylase biotin carboxylase subunit family protein [unclassified Kitasatospora]|uniref:ATP-grasp domain-containing protein n=1 Tax=unclassified Kitasatospora TaxID=2633591 RepID=UPI003819E4D4
MGGSNPTDHPAPPESPSPPSSPTPPVLLVVYGRGSATARGVLTAGRRLCTAVFFGDLGDPKVAADLAQLPKSVTVVDTSGLTEEQLCDRAAEFGASGVITFSDHLLRTASAVAARCGVPFHDRATVEVLVDKFHQREALAAAGVQATACRTVHSAADLGPALAATGLPAVLKPRSGAGSVDTCLVRSAAELADRYAEFTEGLASPAVFVLEEYLVSDPTVVGEFWGDYVSVESAIRDGEIRTVAVTGKLPLAPPFRETGYFTPALLPAGLADEVVALEQRALRALGIREGVTHTEIKFTPDGPRLIEVNGRLGGHVSDVLKRSAGTDLLALALRLALGAFDPPQPVLALGAGCPKVAFQYFISPPADGLAPGPGEVLDGLHHLPGVDLVDATIDPSWRADWRAGTEWLIGTVYGTVPGHPELRATVEGIHRTMADFWS